MADQDDHDSMNEWIAYKENLFGGPGRHPPVAAGPRKARRRPPAAGNKFLVGFNGCQHSVAITLVQETRRASHRRPSSLAVSLSIEDLVRFNQDVSLIASDVSDRFEPVRQQLDTFLDEESRLYFLKYLFGLASKVDSEAVERAVAEYLQYVADKCGLELVRLLLFEREQLEDCEENGLQLQLQGHETLVDRCRQELEAILALRKKAPNLLAVAELYKLEDEAVQQLIVAQAELYFHQLIPFVRMRELALDRIQHLDAVIESADYGDRVKNRVREERAEQQQNLFAAVSAVEQLYRDYYRCLARLSTGQVARAQADQQRYGRNAVQRTGAKDRLDRLRRRCSQEKLEYLNCKLSSTSLEPRQKIQLRLQVLVEEQALLKLDLADLLANDSIDFYDAVQEPDQLDTIVEQKLRQADQRLKRDVEFLKRRMIHNAQQRAKLRLELSKLDAAHVRPPSPSATEKSARKQKLDRFRKDTISRLKRFKMKQLLQSDDPDDDPDECFMDCLPAPAQDSAPVSIPLDQKVETAVHYSPPLPPPPPLLSSPPPPPPPPPPSFNLASPPLKIAKSDKPATAKRAAEPATIDLDELLRMRGQLRSTKDRAPQQAIASRSGDLTQILKSTLCQLRNVVQDDDDEDAEPESSSSDFAEDED